MTDGHDSARWCVEVGTGLRVQKAALRCQQRAGQESVGCWCPAGPGRTWGGVGLHLWGCVMRTGLAASGGTGNQAALTGDPMSWE